MKKQVAGVPLSNFEDPIRYALNRYSSETNWEVVFDSEEAAKLELTPDKPNSARSATPVQHLGETAGTLYVILFNDGDGTGDESTYKLVDSTIGSYYPSHPKVVPRSKANIHSEAHLTIASQAKPQADPVMFAGNLDLVSFREGRFSQLAELGQPLSDYTDAMRDGAAQPTTTFTTGYKKSTGERFGDPHSVFNPRYDLQVCGFLAITNDMAAEHLSILDKLAAVEPDLRF